jgi:hypothetical protein
VRHVVADVIFHEFTHEAIDSASGCGKPLQHIGARFIGVEGAQNTFELTDHLFTAIDEIEFFAGCMAHVPVDYPMGVWYQGSGLRSKSEIDLYARQGRIDEIFVQAVRAVKKNVALGLDSGTGHFYGVAIATQRAR